jgi:hypothetical protein
MQIHYPEPYLTFLDQCLSQITVIRRIYKEDVLKICVHICEQILSLIKRKSNSAHSKHLHLLPVLRRLSLTVSSSFALIWLVVIHYIYILFKLYFYAKAKFTLEQAMKAQRGSRGIALLFL